MIQNLKYIVGSLLMCIALDGYSQDEHYNNNSYIYGTITTLGDESFTGFIRWGKEEMYWHDIFNSVKTRNFKHSVKLEKEGGWKNMDWSISSIWKDNYQRSSHAFACMFGDISAMEIKRGDRVLLEFRNGAVLEVDGGSNDIGAKLRMHEYELGKIQLDWDEIERIEFYQAPSQVKPPYGKELYGTVTTDKRRRFTGHVKWDLDERNGNDILDGESRFGNQEIPFENIKKIAKKPGGNSVDITFASGRNIKLNGSNDCNSGNRGIAIHVSGIGNIELEWNDFDNVVFEKPPVEDRGYLEFPSPQSLYAEVATYDGDSYSGAIAFDKDEIWDFEFVDGDDDDIKYQVPIRNIKLIKPKNRSFSLVELRNGDTVLLGNRQDVCNDNDGILIFENGESEPIYVSWQDVEFIRFK